MVNKPIHISTFLIVHLYMKKAWLEELFTNVTLENISFSGSRCCKIFI